MRDAIPPTVRNKKQIGTRTLLGFTTAIESFTQSKSSKFEEMATSRISEFEACIENSLISVVSLINTFPSGWTLIATVLQTPRLLLSSALSTLP